MKALNDLRKLKTIAQSRPAPPDPVTEWRKTLIGVAKVYGDAGDVETYQAMSDDEIRAEWSRIPEQLDRIYSMTDAQLEEFLASGTAEERQQLAQMSDEQLQAIVDAGTAEAKRKQNNQQ